MSDHDENDHDDDGHRRHHDEVVRLDEGRSEEATGPRGVVGLMERAKDVMTVKRVYGEPIEREGVTVIPAAHVRGGVGGGGGEGARSERGWGGGLGLSAGPAGAFVIKDGVARWRPAIDVNRTIFMGQLVAIVFLLTLRSIVRTLAKRR